ncbi:MAG: DUF4160 domain-containing protein [Gammaproteobacteria bacterium]
MHVHVNSQDGEAKFWLEPIVALASNYGLSRTQLKEIQNLVEEHIHDIVAAWKKHFQN